MGTLSRVAWVEKRENNRNRALAFSLTLASVRDFANTTRNLMSWEFDVLERQEARDRIKTMANNENIKQLRENLARAIMRDEGQDVIDLILADIADLEAQ